MSDKGKSVLERVKDAISKREKKDDPQSRTGSGGRTRANRIDSAVNAAVTGRQREGQSTDSNQ